MYFLLNVVNFLKAFMQKEDFEVFRGESCVGANFINHMHIVLERNWGIFSQKFD